MESISGKTLAALKALFFKDGTKNAIRITEVDDGTLAPSANSQSARSLEQFILSAIELIGGKPALRLVVERPYKVFTALLTQAGTAAPTLKILQNTLGFDAVAVYNGVGSYSLRFDDAQFAVDKTYVQINNASADGTYKAHAKYTGVVATENPITFVTTYKSQVVVYTFDAGVAANDVLEVETSIEIRVYR